MTTPLVLRVATYNIEDVRTDDLLDGENPRLKRIAAVIQELRPDILLLNELAYDQKGAPGYRTGDLDGENGLRFVRQYLGVSQGAGLEPLRYRVYAGPSNTGVASGFDLDNNGEAVSDIPEVPSAGVDGTPGAQTNAGRAYGNDAWGFGMFPGQYGMALFVRDDLRVLDDRIRTFRNLPWSAMPDALRPVDPETGEFWHDEGEWAAVRLSSKSHWDVPVGLPNGAIVHVLCSHPTPPAFDGEEGRNRRRNHDEIRFWADYIDGADYIVDDTGAFASLPEDASFVLLGDMNADPDEGNAIDDPVGRFLLSHPRVNGEYVPVAEQAWPELDDDDTAAWGLRVDYVLPSTDLDVLDGGIRRFASEDEAPGDHFPVWLDLAVPAVVPAGGEPTSP